MAHAPDAQPVGGPLMTRPFKWLLAFLGLWGIILIKLFIMFGILRLFFFPDILKSEFNSDEERSNHVLEQLTNP